MGACRFSLHPGFRPQGLTSGSSGLNRTTEPVFQQPLKRFGEVYVDAGVSRGIADVKAHIESRLYLETKACSGIGKNLVEQGGADVRANGAKTSPNDEPE